MICSQGRRSGRVSLASTLLHPRHSPNDYQEHTVKNKYAGVQQQDAGVRHFNGGQNILSAAIMFCVDTAEPNRADYL